jgi:hypothetical protein
MSHVTTVQLQPITAPRGARWAAEAALAFVDGLQRVFARRHAAPRTPAEEADALRRYALTFRSSDPGFAADLLAAADRHDLRGQ